MTETTVDDRALPPALAETAAVEFDYDEGNGIDLAEQPVVFMGSEGACDVVAGNLSDVPWALADGIGPMEAVEYDDHTGRPDPALTSLAERHATTARRSAQAIIADARAELPTHVEDIDALCQ